MQDLSIKELIQAVRNELVESENERRQKKIDPLFVVDSLKIEVNFVVENKKDTGGKFNLQVVDIGRNVVYTEQQIHKITLDLKTINNDKVSLKNVGGTPPKTRAGLYELDLTDYLSEKYPGILPCTDNDEENSVKV
jgi:hypothetical protein